MLFLLTTCSDWNFLELKAAKYLYFELQDECLTRLHIKVYINNTYLSYCVSYSRHTEFHIEHEETGIKKLNHLLKIARLQTLPYFESFAFALFPTFLTLDDGNL